jgi:hypothetical protein
LILGLQPFLLGQINSDRLSYEWQQYQQEAKRQFEQWERLWQQSEPKVTCESQYYLPHNCPMDTSRGVRIVKELFVSSREAKS